FKKLGIVGSISFSFQSFEAENSYLTREHLQGISNVKRLILSHNSLFTISSEFFVDFPELVMLDLSHNNFTQFDDVFNSTPNLRYIDISNNFIHSISSTLFSKLNYLEHLELGYNPIKEIHGSIFEKLVSLNTLSLRATNIKNATLTLDVLSKLENLETIDISYNNFDSIPSQLFDQNVNLRRVYIENNTPELATLPEILFKYLEKLEEIYLRNNGFFYLPDNLFSNSQLLTRINLGNNCITVLSNNFFQGLANLKILKINNNLIEVIPIGIFKGLVRLKVLDLSMNLIDSIPKGVFEGLTSLTELNMENNRLKYFEKETLIPLENLSIAKFSNNLLDFSNDSTKLSPFYFNTFLKELHLSNNSIHRFFTDWSTSSDLTFLNLTHNNISYLSFNKFSFKSNKALVDLRHNGITNILLKGIELSTLLQTVKRDVKVLIDHNPILCDCNLYDLIRYFHNEMPTFVYNYIEFVAQNLSCIYTNGTMGPKIEKLNSTTYTCAENEYFKMDTRCPTLCKCSVRISDKTRFLDCSNKNMSSFVIDDQSHYFVNGFPVILNLTGNNLTGMPIINLSKPINITGLLLSNNRISEITIDNLPQNLTILELHNNSIYTIGSNVIKRFNSSLLTKLTLSGNPIICDCTVDNLMKFAKLNRKVYKDLNNVKCQRMNVPLYRMSIEFFCSSVIKLWD
ncbi:hypothetical protein M0802_016899, partial [Mischocyttarus mexicanus]